MSQFLPTRNRFFVAKNIRTHKWLVLGLSCLVIGLGLVTSRYTSSSLSLRAEGLLAKPWSRVLGDSTSSTSRTLTYSLLEGWNLVHFPVIPDKFTTASGLVKTIAQDGGYVTVVATWQDGAWKEYIQRGATAYSPDFPVEPGKAYFLRSHRQLTWKVTGSPPAGGPLSLTLQPGWNSVGLFLSPDKHASSVLNALNKSLNPKPSTSTPSVVEGLNPEAATEIDRWLSGTWQVFVKRIYAPDNIQEYGDDFALSQVEGYMIKALEPVTVNLTENKK